MNNETKEKIINFLESFDLPTDNLEYITDEDYRSAIFPFFFFLGIFQMISVTNIIIHFYCSFNNIFLVSENKQMLSYW